MWEDQNKNFLKENVMFLQKAVITPREKHVICKTGKQNLVQK